MNAPRHEIDSRPRLIAKLVRQVVAGETFETYADFVDALKCRLARLRIRWTNEDLDAALQLVESNRPLIAPPPVMRHQRVEITGVQSIPRTEAPRVLADVAEKTGRACTVRSMPPVTMPPDPADEDAARERAWEMGIEL